ncbi:MAG: hypothetical protein ABJM29_08840 [Rhizobiaceae bacterium]
MACTRTLKMALVALAFLAGLLIFDMTSQARESGMSTIAGDRGAQANLRAKARKFRAHQRKLRKSKRRGRRSLHDTLFIVDTDDLPAESNTPESIRRNSFLRNKVSVMRRRPGSKIIHVSEKMKQLGEERAAKREERMLEQIDKLDIRFYRDNEAYDARFPSIVFLELLKK